MSTEYWWSDQGPDLYVAAPFGLGPRRAAEVASGLGTLKWVHSRQHRPSTRRLRTLFNFGVVVEDIPGSEKATLRIWVDCIDWLRGVRPQFVDSYHLRLAETFFLTTDYQEDRSTSGSHGAVTRIRPLLLPEWVERRTERKHKTSDIVLAFGGMRTPYLPDDFLKRWAALHVEGLAKATTRSVRVYLPQALVPGLERLARPRAQRLQVLPLADPASWRGAVQETSLLLLQPGLYGPFEAFSAESPLRLLSPYSWTQVYQLQKMTQHGLVDVRPPWWHRMQPVIEPHNPEVPNLAEEQELCCRVIDWFNASDRGELLEELGQWFRGVCSAPVPDLFLRKRRQHVEGLNRLPCFGEILAAL